MKSEAGSDETTIRIGTPANLNRACVVIFENGETDVSILDGFTITGGRGIFDPSVNASGGGGIVLIASSGIVKNCVVVQNSADAGGGVICAGNALATVSNCTIKGNSATIIGAGLYAVSGSSMILTNCTITGNSVVRSGGGVACWENSSVTLTDCIISDNSATGAILHEAGYGGGLYEGNGSIMTITNCRIVKNSAGVGGGGVLLNGNLFTITGCTISDNSAGNWGGGVGCEFEDTLLSMRNCIIARNTAEKGGGGLACYLGATMTVDNCTIWNNSGGSTWGGGGVGCGQGTATVTNSIICANTSPEGREISVITGGKLNITYSNVAGGQAGVNAEGDTTLNWGESNIDADPLFADAANNDYHLKSQACRWDPNSSSWVQDDVTSPCIDAGDPDSDWSGETWPHGERINMGVYGGTREASMSTRPEAMSLPRVAFIYRSDTEAAASFQSLLMSYGCPTTLIGIDDVTAIALDSCDLIVVASDAGYSSTWQDTPFVATIESTGKPIVGLGQGGYNFFGILELWIGRPNGGHGNRNSIEVVDPNCSLFSTPYSVDIPEDRALQLYTETNHIGIYFWPTIPETVRVLASEVNDDGYFPLALENDRYLFWGFTESPQKMTDIGKILFINVVIWPANAGWEIEI